MTIDERLLLSFKELISQKTGLRIRSQDNESLKRVIEARAKVNGISSAEEYYRYLSDSSNYREKKDLIVLLTVGESYFFRDDGQFKLLKERILPDLIRKREGARSIRVWSAGCSTGEEPYSIAILLDTILPDARAWNVTIIGTDIKSEFLDRAKAGLYRDWSFRVIKPEVHGRYFRKSGDQWEIDDRIRKMVTFSQGDLLMDTFPNYVNGLYDMDLIICRNVFIYYGREAIISIAEKMAHTLREGGYLITGHNELFAIPMGILKPRLFPESMVYLRERPRLMEVVQPLETGVHSLAPGHTGINFPEIKKAPPSAPKPPAPKEEPAKKEDPRESNITAAEAMMKKGEYMAAIESMKPLLKENPSDFMALYLTGASYANLGEHEQAAVFLRKAIEADRLAIEPYFVLAHIALENGSVEEAKGNFRKVIYLKHSCAPAYMELASIYDAEGDGARARKMRESALDALVPLSDDSVVKPYDGATAGELREYLKRTLE